MVPQYFLDMGLDVKNKEGDTNMGLDRLVAAVCRTHRKHTLGG